MKFEEYEKVLDIFMRYYMRFNTNKNMDAIPNIYNDLVTELLGMVETMI